jgi:predicted MFS family arabinose efflux permease
MLAGTVLGLSAALVMLANAAASVIGGLIYQQYGMTAPTKKARS